MALRHYLMAVAGAAAFFVSPAVAQMVAPTYSTSNGNTLMAQGVVLLNADGTPAVLAGPSGSGGDASAANQATQITAEQAIRDRIGATTSPAAGSTNAILNALLTGPLTVGTHAVTQSGAWSVGLTGTLPAYASPPTVNLGTIAGVATSANQSTEIASLSSIATNTTGAATAARQDTGNSSLATIGTNTAAIATGNTALAAIQANTAALPTGSPVRTFDETNAIAGRGFSWGTGVVSVNSGQRLNVVFTNPTGSGKTAYIVLREFGQSSGVPLTATLYTNPAIPAGSTTSGGGNRLMGAATTSVSTLSYITAAGVLATGTAGPAVFIEPNGAPVDTLLLRIVPPGFSFGYTIMAPGGGLAAATSISFSVAGWEQ